MMREEQEFRVSIALILAVLTMFVVAVVAGVVSEQPAHAPATAPAPTAPSAVLPPPRQRVLCESNAVYLEWTATGVEARCMPTSGMHGHEAIIDDVTGQAHTVFVHDVAGQARVVYVQRDGGVSR